MDTNRRLPHDFLLIMKGGAPSGYVNAFRGHRRIFVRPYRPVWLLARLNLFGLELANMDLFYPAHTEQYTSRMQELAAEEKVRRTIYPQ